MGKIRLFFLISMLCGLSVFGQYTMSTQTVTSCEGTLTDSEANIVNPGYYNHNENYSFTICPPNAVSIQLLLLFLKPNQYMILSEFLMAQTPIHLL